MFAERTGSALGGFCFRVVLKRILNFGREVFDSTPGIARSVHEHTAQPDKRADGVLGEIHVGIDVRVMLGVVRWRDLICHTLFP